MIPRPLRLNLACGTDIREGWLNLDVVHKWPLAARPCDVIWDARVDEIPLIDGVVDEIYAGYLLLHLAPRHHARVLSDIHRVLRPGGVLVVGEVDMAVLLPRWLERPDDPYLSGLVWGEQGDLSAAQVAHLSAAEQEEQRSLSQFDEHHQGFTEASLARLLRRVGFEDVGRIKIQDPGVWYELTLVARKP